MLDKSFFIGTGWKMNKTLAEGLEFSRALADAENSFHNLIRPFIVPPFTILREMASVLSGCRTKVGAQNMHWEDFGAWTGEISAPMIKDCGAQMVELGHFERRRSFNETDEIIGLKVANAVKSDLIPIICISETALEFQSSKTKDVLQHQVSSALKLVDWKHQDCEILLAYEPGWAIGDLGTPATVEQVSLNIDTIKNVTNDLLKREIPCLYGGSVNAENCEQLAKCKNLDGLFIGRAALDVQNFLHMIHLCQRIV